MGAYTIYTTHLRHRFVIKIVIAHNGFITIGLINNVRTFVPIVPRSLALMCVLPPSALALSLSLSISLWRPALGEGYCNTYATRSSIRKTRRKINLVFRLPQRNKFSKFSENRKTKTEKRKTISEVFYCAP